MLKIIAGRSGSGKTYEVFQRICDSENTKNIILIVPEQSSFQSERTLLNMLGAKKAARIKVYSFKRLCNIVSETYGGRTGKRAGDGDKAVLMSMAIHRIADRLVLYGSRTGKNDFVELMLNAVNEYKMCAVSPDMLFAAASVVSNYRLKQKLMESAYVYQAYNAVVSRSYIDPDDDLTYLYEVLKEQPFFRGKTVYIDSFNGFSGQEIKILECIMQQAEDLYMTLGCDRIPWTDVNHSFFAEPCKTMYLLKSLAERNGIEIADTLWLDTPKRYHSSALADVEESLFRFDGDSYENDGSVTIYDAEDKYDEIRRIAMYISTLVFDGGYAYRDINILCRNPDDYKNIIDMEFGKFHIPFFMSDPQPLESKPLVKFILGAFDTVHSSFDTGKLFSFLKTGLCHIEDQEIFLLENYAYLWDIRGKMWKKPFTLNPNGNSEKIDHTQLEQLENIRCKIVKPLEIFSETLKKAQNGAEMSRAVYGLLEDMNVKEKIRSLTEYYENLGEIKAKEEQIRIWNVMMDILDRMYFILSDTVIDSKRYGELLRLMISKNPVSDIPQTLDQVTIGEAGKFRTENPKAVFVIGAVENVFPAVVSSSGMFTDSEREELINAALPLYDTLYAASLKEKHTAYAALSAPTEKLFVSFYRSNTSGDICEPSMIVRELLDMFENIRPQTKYHTNETEMFFTEKQSFDICAEEWNDHTARSATLKQYFCESENFSGKIRSIERAVNDMDFEIVSKNVPEKLFGEKPVLSASQIDTYYECPFLYFCRYGLHILKPKKAIMDPSLYGSAVHYILEKILKEQDFEEVKQSSVQVLEELTEKYLQEYINKIGGNEERTSRFMSQMKSMKKNIVIILKRLVDEFLESSFVPSDLELSISDDGGEIPSYQLQLPNGRNVSVVGKIDRVDTFVKDNEKYIRIVDYKTGNKKFKLSEVLYGLNVQMLLYLAAIEQNGGEYYSENGTKKLLPAGVLYMPAAAKSTYGSVNSESEKNSMLAERTKSLKMNGIIINDTEVLNAMENGIKGIYIPAGLKKDGSFSAASSITSLENFGHIFRYIDKKIIKMASSLLDGKIERCPSKGKFDPCQYCDYKNVCGYENGKPYRKIEYYNTDEVLKMMKDGEENE